MKSTALDGFIAERWNEAVEFVGAFHDLEERAMAMFEQEAGPKVQEWLADLGYEVHIDPKYAEFRAYRKDWLDGQEDSKALFVIGGLFPTGFMKVDSLHPYLWVYLRGEREVRIRRAEQLRSSVPQGSEWLNAETDHRQPLGRYLHDVQPTDRMKLMLDPGSLAELVIQRMPALLELDERVSRALAVA